jgi:S-adenosylmethionine:tRNA ribosyltransferase-isomerase
MKISDLDFEYPERLVGTKPQNPTRVMDVSLAPGQGPREITLQQLLEQIPAGDVLVINNTKVLKRRLFAAVSKDAPRAAVASSSKHLPDLEILFLSQKSPRQWEVLFPSKKIKIGETIALPGEVTMTLVKKGRPQLVELSQEVDESYFQTHGELPLPPYIQKARDQRHTVSNDETWYQTVWAEKPGSFAAPTASLHFNEAAMAKLKAKGVVILEMTLHVGLGTFLPVTADDLDQHDMHEEYAEIPNQAWQQIQSAKKQSHKIWALGTTATRALESAAQGLLGTDQNGNLQGFTKILIQPPYQFQIVDRLLTNFHQPQSTLLALVAAFAGLEKVKACYLWAIERDFRLFSYGDLSVWRN